jgi:hypothetical protein
VAVKFLADRYREEPEVVRRFLREAQATASLEHPNVVRVQAIGENEGHPYLVMEYVEGRTVAERLREEGRVPLPEAVAIASQVCYGLSHIHARGYVHRDIKSQNILVEPGGRAVLLDFGIVRVTGGSSTRTVLLAGTPEYMSPEQAMDPGTVDGRSDLYSLAVAFFEMVTGRVPFRSSSPFKVLLQHQAKAPPRATELAPDLPAAVDAFFQRALAKDPGARFQSAETFREGLTLLLRADGVPARRARSRWQLPAAAAVVLLLGAAAAWSALTDEPAAEPRARAPGNIAPRPAPPPVPKRELPVASGPTFTAVLPVAPKKPLLRPERPRKRRAPPKRRKPAPSPRPLPVAPLVARAPLPPQPPPVVSVEDERPALLHVVTLHEDRGLWARIYVGDELVKESHAAYRQLPHGTYTVTARREGFREVTRRVTLAPGEQRKVVLVLEKE